MRKIRTKNSYGEHREELQALGVHHGGTRAKVRQAITMLFVIIKVWLVAAALIRRGAPCTGGL